MESAETHSYAVLAGASPAVVVIVNDCKSASAMTWLALSATYNLPFTTAMPAGSLSRAAFPIPSVNAIAFVAPSTGVHSPVARLSRATVFGDDAYRYPWLSPHKAFAVIPVPFVIGRTTFV